MYVHVYIYIYIFTNTMIKKTNKTYICYNVIIQYILIGGFNPSEKYESQIGSSSQLIIGKKKNHVPNHQPVICVSIPLYSNFSTSYIILLKMGYFHSM